jgi:hypothetical protein
LVVQGYLIATAVQTGAITPRSGGTSTPVEVWGWVPIVQPDARGDSVKFGPRAGAQSVRAMFEDRTGSTTTWWTIYPADMDSAWTWTPPPNTGITGQVLMTDGTGASSWETVAGTGDVTGAGVANSYLSVADSTGPNPRFRLSVTDAPAAADSFLVSDGAGGLRFSAGDGAGGGSGDVTGVGVLGGLAVADSGGPKPLLSVKAGGIASGHLAAGAVGDSSKIAAGAVTRTRIASGSVSAVQIMDGQVKSAELAAGAVADSSKLGAGAVTVTKLGTGSVYSGTIKDGQVKSGDLAANAVSDSTKIAAGAVRLSDLASTTAAAANEVLSATSTGVMNWQPLADAQLPATITIGTGESIDVSGTGHIDATMMNIQARAVSGTIAAGSVVYAASYNPSGWVEVGLADANGTGTMPAIGIAEVQLTTGAGGSVITRGVLSGQVTTGATVGAPIFVSETPGAWTQTLPANVGTEVQELGYILRAHTSLGDILVQPIDTDEMQNLESAKLWVGNGSNRPTAVALSSDVTMANTGAVTIAANAVGAAELVAGAVGDSTDVSAAAITATRIGANAIHTGHIKDGQVKTADLAASAVDSSKIAAAHVPVSKIKANDSPANTEMLTYTGGDFEWRAQTADFSMSCSGKPTAAEVLLRVPMVRNVYFVANFSGSQGVTGTNTTAHHLWRIKKNGTEIGTCKFVDGSATGTFVSTSGAAQSFAAGDVLTICAPDTVDATMADIGIQLKGTKGD